MQRAREPASWRTDGRRAQQQVSGACGAAFEASTDSLRCTLQLRLARKQRQATKPGAGALE